MTSIFLQFLDIFITYFFENYFGDYLWNFLEICKFRRQAKQFLWEFIWQLHRQSVLGIFVIRYITCYYLSSDTCLANCSYLCSLCLWNCMKISFGISLRFYSKILEWISSTIFLCVLSRKIFSVSPRHDQIQRGARGSHGPGPPKNLTWWIRIWITKNKDYKKHIVI